MNEINLPRISLGKLKLKYSSSKLSHKHIPFQQAAKAQAESASTQKAEREVTRMVVVMVLGFLVCWMPYASFALWVVNNRGHSFDLRLATIPSCLSKASTVYNPVIYVLLNKQVSFPELRVKFEDVDPLYLYV